MLPIFDPTMVLLIPAILLAVWAQFKVQSTYARYSQVATRRGLTGARVAAEILEDNGIEVVRNPEQVPDRHACALEPTPGHLTDHYSPTERTLRLSEEVYGGTSIAALGIAAHEVGHAIQHARAYSPLMLRNVVYPVCNIGSTLAFPIFIVGLFMAAKPLMQIGILLFAFAVFFTLITLPVEFDASRRAVKSLASGGYLAEDELVGARKVLNAAAMTYVAASAMAILNLVRLLILARASEE